MPDETPGGVVPQNDNEPDEKPVTGQTTPAEDVVEKSSVEETIEANEKSSDFTGTTHAGEINFSGASPAEMVREREIENGDITEAPPAEADYRDPEISGIVCAHCSHYEEQLRGEEGVESSGVCHLWEAAVKGGHVCNKFTIDHSMTDSETGKVHSFSDDEEGQFEGIELFNPAIEGEKIEFSKDDGAIIKTIMRTGVWKKTPGTDGVRRKPLQVVRDGKSSLKDGIIALSELVENFDNKAYQYVTIPLSDTQKDHNNLTRNNTGYLKRVWIEDVDEERANLQGELMFTEPEIDGKVRRGTIPDCSAGVYFNVERPDGEKFNSAINHVCLTKSPFMSDLGAFGGITLSDQEDGDAPNVMSGYVPESMADAKPDWDKRLGFSWQHEQITSALADQAGLDTDHYSVTDIGPKRAVVKNDIANLSWVVPFELEDESVKLSEISEWEVRDQDDEEERSEEPTEPAATPGSVTLSNELTALEQARSLRALRATPATTNGGDPMTPTGVEGIDFSDPDAAREAFQEVLAQNQRLTSESRKGSVHTEIERVKGMGFSDEPGFLRVYRDILLSEDEEPAMVLLSHDDDGNKIGQNQVTGSEIAKKLISALRVNDEGKVLLAQQHEESGSEEPPPADENDDEKSDDERLAEAEEFLHGKKPSSAGTGEEK